MTVVDGAGTRIAVVGYGYWGSKHVRVLCATAGVSVAVVDQEERRLAEAAARHPGVERYRHLRDVLDDVDGVVVATPAGSHAAVAEQALRAGRHVLVEKPLTTSVADAERLVDLARHAGVHLMTGHTFEYNPAVRKLREIVRSGALGRTLYIDAQRLNLGRYQPDVDVVWDLAPHDISIVSYLLDEMPSSTSVWAQRNVGVRHNDVAHLRLDFPRSRVTAYLHVSWLSPRKVRTVTVVGTRRMAVYDDMSADERIRVYDIGVDPATVDDGDGAHDVPMTYRTGDITSPHIDFAEPLALQDGHFVDCIHGRTRCLTPGRRGLEVVRVLDAAGRAAASGSPAGVGDLPIRLAVS